MAHGLAVYPGSGAEQCGSTGAYCPDTICSSCHTARFRPGQGASTTLPNTSPASI